MIGVRFENISKLYRLGEQSTGFFLQDWRRLREGREKNDLWALKNVSFDAAQGDIVGIVGHNGDGKSTLPKLLCRITTPTSGTIYVRGKIASLLEVGTGFHSDMTGRENIFLNGAILGMPKSEIAKKLDAIAAFAECEPFLDTPVKRYSNGMLVRLGFAVAAHLDAQILVIDEVLSVGDVDFQQKAIQTLQQKARDGATILFVSHNTQALKMLCNKGLFLQKGRIAHEGTIDECVERYLQK